MRTTNIGPCGCCGGATVCIACPTLTSATVTVSGVGNTTCCGNRGAAGPHTFWNRTWTLTGPTYADGSWQGSSGYISGPNSCWVVLQTSHPMLQINRYIATLVVTCETESGARTARLCFGIVSESSGEGVTVCCYVCNTFGCCAINTFTKETTYVGPFPPGFVIVGPECFNIDWPATLTLQGFCSAPPDG